MLSDRNKCKTAETRNCSHVSISDGRFGNFQPCNWLLITHSTLSLDETKRALLPDFKLSILIIKRFLMTLPWEKDMERRIPGPLRSIPKLSPDTCLTAVSFRIYVTWLSHVSDAEMGQTLSQLCKVAPIFASLTVKLFLHP